MSITTKPSFATGPPVPVRRASVDSEIGSSRPFDIAGDGKVIGLVEAGASATASAASTSQLHVVLNWIEELKQRVPLK